MRIFNVLTLNSKDMKKLLLPLLSLIILTSCKKENPVVDNVYNFEIPEVIIKKAADTALINKSVGEYMKLNTAHKNLALENGIWEEDIQYRVAKNSPLQNAKGTVSCKMILNGLHQEFLHKGNMNNFPFEGKGTLSYDNIKKEYIYVWIDNMSSGVTIMKGKMDYEKNILTLNGKNVDPVNKNEKSVKQIITYLSPTQQKIEIFDVDYNGKDFKSMEMTLTKK